jgi:hypothetical protein
MLILTHNKNTKAIQNPQQLLEKNINVTTNKNVCGNWRLYVKAFREG